MTNPPPKVISVVAHPLQVSHLGFAVDGILEDPAVELGASVVPFDFRLFYKRLTSPGAAPGVLAGGIPTVPPDHSRPLYDSEKLEAYVAPSRLASLRAEPSRAALAQALSARQNAFFAKYGNAAEIIAVTKESYDVTVVGAKTSKSDRLATLAKLSQQQAEALEAAYTADKRTDVVKHTGSTWSSSTESSGWTSSSGEVTDTTGPPTSKGSACEAQTVVSTDYGYRMPFIETQAQNERAQISLIDEGFAEYMFRQNLGSLETVFANELLSIDNDVYQRQVALANRWLMSPIKGTVTVVYKYPGDAVRAGEPVMRVENNAKVLLTAALVSRRPISVLANATVETTLFDTPGAAKTQIPGQVVAVRGQHEDDRWDVIIKCDNLDGAGNAILPASYHFDYDNTTVTIT